MIRLAVSVEGETEEELVEELLAPHLQSGGVYATPVLIGRARGRATSGGNVTIDRLAREMRHLRQDFEAVTSLVDYYGFGDKGGRRPNDLLKAISDRIGQCDERFVFPYVQLHEFEGLLFSNAEAFGRIFPDAPIIELESIRSRFDTPEDVNDHQETAPSKRIKRLIPRYRKALHGPLLAREIGFGQNTQRVPAIRYLAAPARSSR